MKKVYNALNVLEAAEVMIVLKEYGIPSYQQNAGAGVVAHDVSGFGLYGVDVFVNDSDSERALEIIHMDDSKEA